MDDNVVQNNQQEQVQAPRPGTPESETPMSGYIPDSRAVQRDQQAQQPPPVDNTELEQLSQRLGVRPEDIGQPPAPEQPEQPLNTEDWYAKQFGTEEARQFAENFKKYVGMDIKEVYNVVNNTARVTQGLEQWRQEVRAERDTQTLRSEWGQDFDNIMPLVAQKFQHIQKTNPQQARALDNLDGARMLAALVRQEQQQGYQAKPNVPQTPAFLPNRRPIQRGVGATPSSIKMSDYVSMNDHDAQQVNAGLMNGSIQIIHDM